jgi:RNA polymerase sigma factor (sigma-70 family)
MTDGQQLLAEYAKNGSEAAFRELVTLYTNLVYSAALRLVDGNTHLAQDVAQTVFIDLARMARGLSSEVMLGGWLHRHTCFVASKAMRSERRRLARERKAFEMTPNHSDTGLSEVVPIIDDAINQLGEQDRAAILLRFFEQYDFRSVGLVLGSTEDTAQKRVSRALDKLHFLLKQRGVTLSAAALGTALAAEAVTAAPASLAATFATAALAGGTAASTATLTFAKLIAMTKLKLGAIAALAVVGVAVPVWTQHQDVVRLRHENQALRLQLDDVAQIAADNQRLSNLVARANNPLAGEQLGELLKLRGEVGSLRRQVAEQTRKEKIRAPASTQPAQAEAAEQQQKDIFIAKMNYTQSWMLAFTEYAAQHQGQFPTNFELAASFLPPEAAGLTNLTSDQFEIVYTGAINDITNPQSIIVIREKDAFQTPDGGWVRDYSFADGHSEIHKAVDGNFQPWEAQHLPESPTAPQREQ